MPLANAIASTQFVRPQRLRKCRSNYDTIAALVTTLLCCKKCWSWLWLLFEEIPGHECKHPTEMVKFDIDNSLYSECAANGSLHGSARTAPQPSASRPTSPPVGCPWRRRSDLLQSWCGSLLRAQVTVRLAGPVGCWRHRPAEEGPSTLHGGAVRFDGACMSVHGSRLWRGGGRGKQHCRTHCTHSITHRRAGPLCMSRTCRRVGRMFQARGGRYKWCRQSCASGWARCRTSSGPSIEDLLGWGAASCLSSAVSCLFSAACKAQLASVGS